MKYVYLAAGSLLLLSGKGYCRAPLPNQTATQSTYQDGSPRRSYDPRAVVYAEKTRQANVLTKQGKVLVTQGKVAEGIRLYQQALQTQPQSPETLLLLADVYERQGKFSDALQAYRAIYQPNFWGGSIASDPTTHMRFVLALLRANQTQEAVRMYELGMNNTVTDIPGEVFLDAQMRHDDTALRALYATHPRLLDLRFDPKNPDITLLQAAAHLVLGMKEPFHTEADPAEQMQRLLTAARLAPRWGRVYSALADAYSERGQKQEAQAAQARALALGDHASQQEQILKAEDQNSREHMLRYDPDKPERYHFHDPKMMPTQAEREAAMQALRARAGGNAPVSQ